MGYASTVTVIEEVGMLITVTSTTVPVQKVLHRLVGDTVVPVVVGEVRVTKGIAVILDSVGVQDELEDSADGVNNVSDQEVMGVATTVWSSPHLVHVTSFVLAGGRHSFGSTVASYSSNSSTMSLLMGGGMGQAV